MDRKVRHVGFHACHALSSSDFKGFMLTINVLFLSLLTLLEATAIKAESKWGDSCGFGESFAAVRLGLDRFFE